MFCPIRFNGVDLLKESRMCTTAIVNRLYMMEYGEIVKLEYNHLLVTDPALTYQVN